MSEAKKNLLKGTGKAVIDSGSYGIGYGTTELLVVGKTYTISAYVDKVERLPLDDVSDGRPKIAVYDGGGYWSGGSLAGDVPGQQHLTFIYKQPFPEYKDPNRIYIYNTPPIGTGVTRKMSFRNLMLVEGSEPAAWAPAEGETLAGGGALVSANLLDGVKPKINYPDHTTESDGVISFTAKPDGWYDIASWTLDEPTLAENQIIRFGVSMKWHDAAATAGDAYMSVKYADAAGNINNIDILIDVIATEWRRFSTSAVVPSGMHIVDFHFSAQNLDAGYDATNPTLSYGTEPLVLAIASSTLAWSAGILATVRYYLLAAPTSATPTVPASSSSLGSWSETEPAADVTKVLWTCECTHYTDGTESWSQASKSTSYEAAKDAKDAATAAQSTADTAKEAAADNASEIASIKTDYVTNSTFDQSNTEIKASVADTLSQAKTYTDNSVETEVTNRNAAITESANEIKSEVSETYATQDSLAAANSAITQNANAISSEVTARETTDSNVSTLSTKVTQNADSITTEISDRESAVSAVDTKATTAQSTADAAKSAAATAQSTADSANTGLTTLAGKTGRVIYSSTAPTGDDANANNLWIDTDDGKLYTYSGSTWTLVTDTRLTAAANAASAAQSTADDAKSAATTLSTLIRESSSGVDVGKSSDGTAYSTSVARVGSDGAFHILTSALVEVAKYAGNLVELGKNSASSVIKFCGGKVSVSAVPDAKDRYTGILSGDYGAKMRSNAGRTSIGVDGFQDLISMVSGYLLVNDGTDALTQISMRRFLTAIQPVVLYNGGAALRYDTAPGAGTTGTVTLSESAANFAELTMYLTDNNGRYAGAFPLAPLPGHTSPSVGQTCDVYGFEAAEGERTWTYIRRTRYTLSTATALVPSNGGWVEMRSDFGVNFSADGVNYLKIYRVTGRR
jgi:hypothetical protein